MGLLNLRQMLRDEGDCERIWWNVLTHPTILHVLEMRRVFSHQQELGYIVLCANALRLPEISLWLSLYRNQTPNSKFCTQEVSVL